VQSWVPTHYLRWEEDSKAERILMQKWEEEYSGEELWLEVHTVEKKPHKGVQ